jgi:hypothetical protein
VWNLAALTFTNHLHFDLDQALHRLPPVTGGAQNPLGPSLNESYRARRRLMEMLQAKYTTFWTKCAPELPGVYSARLPRPTTCAVAHPPSRRSRPYAPLGFAAPHPATHAKWPPPCAPRAGWRGRSHSGSQYGLWLLITSMTGYLGLMNLGIPMASVHFIAKYDAQKSIHVFRGTLQPGFLVLSAPGVIMPFCDK